MLIFAAIPGVIAALLAVWRERSVRFAIGVGLLVTLVALLVLMVWAGGIGGYTVGYEFTP